MGAGAAMEGKDNSSMGEGTGAMLHCCRHPPLASAGVGDSLLTHTQDASISSSLECVACQRRHSSHRGVPSEAALLHACPLPSPLVVAATTLKALRRGAPVSSMSSRSLQRQVRRGHCAQQFTASSQCVSWDPSTLHASAWSSSFNTGISSHALGRNVWALHSWTSLTLKLRHLGSPLLRGCL